MNAAAPDTRATAAAAQPPIRKLPEAYRLSPALRAPALPAVADCERGTCAMRPGSRSGRGSAPVEPPGHACEYLDGHAEARQYSPALLRNSGVTARRRTDVATDALGPWFHQPRAPLKGGGPVARGCVGGRWAHPDALVRRRPARRTRTRRPQSPRPSPRPPAVAPPARSWLLPRRAPRRRRGRQRAGRSRRRY